MPPARPWRRTGRKYMMLTKDQKEFLRQAERLFSEAPFAAIAL